MLQSRNPSRVSAPFGLGLSVWQAGPTGQRLESTGQAWEGRSPLPPPPSCLPPAWRSETEPPPRPEGKGPGDRDTGTSEHG